MTGCDDGASLSSRAREVEMRKIIVQVMLVVHSLENELTSPQLI